MTTTLLVSEHHLDRVYKDDETTMKKLDEKEVAALDWLGCSKGKERDYESDEKGGRRKKRGKTLRQNPRRHQILLLPDPDSKDLGCVWKGSMARRSQSSFMSDICSSLSFGTQRLRHGLFSIDSQSQFWTAEFGEIPFQTIFYALFLHGTQSFGTPPTTTTHHYIPLP